MSRADLTKDSNEITSMFGGVGKNYDITNTVLTGGIDHYWCIRTAKRLNLRPDQKVLDLATGTVVPSAELAKPGAYIVTYDFSRGMLKTDAHRNVPRVRGDGMKLPFPGNTLDTVTIGFGLHNTMDYKTDLAEPTYAAGPEGRPTVCEFSTPVMLMFNTFYKGYPIQILPQIVKVASLNPRAYIYLAESIRVWSSQSQFVRDISASSWESAS